MVSTKNSISALSKTFETFSRTECHNSSPLYEKLSLAISRDEEMLKFASNSVHGPIPNILFASIHYLILKGKDNGLSVFYPDTTDNPEMEKDPYPLFRDFCRDYRSEIKLLLKSKYVQTNEVQRCSLLMPALNQVYSEAKEPLSVVEVGTSAGLNLLFDQYRYDYGKDFIVGNRNSEISLKCVLKGDNFPPLKDGLPKINFKAGIDLNPIDPHDEEAVTWLKALIWPEHTKRRRTLEAAILEAQKHNLELVRGDALEVLQKIIDRVPLDSALCVFSTFTLNQFPRKKHEKFTDHLVRASIQRPVYSINIGFADGDSHQFPEIMLTRFQGGKAKEERLAICHPYGEWLEWLKKD